MVRQLPLLALLSACSGILGFDPPMHRVDGGGKQADGTPCTPGADNECANGNCVTEAGISICCGAACDAPCRSCLAANTGKADGQCEPVGSGLDPKDGCAAGECAAGSCDGAGACQKVDDRTACSDGRSCCAGECVSERTDPAHCGMCGQSCSAFAGEICSVGACGVVDWALWPMPAGGAAEPNPPSYTDNGDGTVTDNVTKLMWQKTVNVNTYGFASAQTYCANTLSNQGFAHHHDWRLPTRIELVSLVNYDIAAPGPTIDQGAFPDTPQAFFWTSTPFAGVSSSGWFVSFGSGVSGFRDMGDLYRVRCVR